VCKRIENGKLETTRIFTLAVSSRVYATGGKSLREKVNHHLERDHRSRKEETLKVEMLSNEKHSKLRPQTGLAKRTSMANPGAPKLP